MNLQKYRPNLFAWLLLSISRNSHIPTANKREHPTFFLHQLTRNQITTQGLKIKVVFGSVSVWLLSSFGVGVVLCSLYLTSAHVCILGTWQANALTLPSSTLCYVLSFAPLRIVCISLLFVRRTALLTLFRLRRPNVCSFFSKWMN